MYGSNVHRRLLYITRFCRSVGTTGLKLGGMWWCPGMVILVMFVITGGSTYWSVLAVHMVPLEVPSVCLSVTR